jgi:hypothetical protein
MSTEPKAEADRTRPRTDWKVLTAAGVAVALLGGAAGAFTALRFAPSTVGSCDAVRVAETVLPAVVTVFATAANGQGGTGSGAITTADGVIVTNDHVVHVAVAGGSIEVLMNSGERLPATLVGTSSSGCPGPIGGPTAAVRPRCAAARWCSGRRCRRPGNRDVDTRRTRRCRGRRLRTCRRP